MPMNDAPLSVASLKHGSSQSTTINMTCLSGLANICGYGVLERRPRGVTGQVNLDVTEAVLRVLHLAHLGDKVMIAIVGPAVICVAALEDRQRFIIGPDL